MSEKIMTEEQGIKLCEVGNKFWEDFSKLVGEAVSELPPEFEDQVLYYIQDRTSVFGSKYSEYVKR